MANGDPPPESEFSKCDLARAAMQTLWPAFIGAIICVGVVFSLFDPNNASDFPDYFPQSVEGVYTITFLLLWAANAASCGVTWYLAGRRG